MSLIVPLEYLKKYIQKHNLNYRRATLAGYKRYMKDKISDLIQKQAKDTLKTLKNLRDNSMIKEAVDYNTVSSTSSETGLYIDYKIFNTVISKHLGFILTDSVPVKYPVNKVLTSLLLKYSSKVPSNIVKKVVNNVVSVSEIGIVLVPSRIFPARVGVDIELTPKLRISSYFVEVVDSELFHKYAQMHMQQQEFDENEYKTTLEGKIFKEVELNVPDYYYGIYFEYIVYKLTENYSKVFVDLILLSKVVKAISKLIIDLFANRYSTGKVDEDYLNMAVAWVIANKYLGVKNSELFLNSIGKVLGVEERKLNKIISEFKELKYKQYSGFMMLPIFLKNLGLFLFSTNEFLNIFLRAVGHTFKMLDKSYPHLVATIVVSKYPTTFTTNSFDEKIATDIEEYVFKTYRI